MPWYFIVDILFCLMAIGAIIWSWPHLSWIWRVSAIIAAILIMPLQILNEYLSLHVLFAWTFSLEHNRMIGWTIAGTPIEEYLFWFAFAWLCPFLYSGFVVWFAKRDKIKGRVIKVDPHE